jgi:hypothetical protein
MAISPISTHTDSKVSTTILYVPTDTIPIISKQKIIGIAITNATSKTHDIHIVKEAIFNFVLSESFENIVLL